GGARCGYGLRPGSRGWRRSRWRGVPRERRLPDARRGGRRRGVDGCRKADVVGRPSPVGGSGRAGVPGGVGERHEGAAVEGLVGSAGRASWVQVRGAVRRAVRGGERRRVSGADLAAGRAPGGFRRRGGLPGGDRRRGRGWGGGTPGGG